MTFTEFWRSYSSGLLAVITAVSAYVIWTKLSITKLEGRVISLEKIATGNQDCIKTLQQKESEEKVRAYRADESDRKVAALSEQIREGFAKLDGSINTINVQTMQVIEQLGNQQKSLDKAWRKLEEHDRYILGAHIGKPPGEEDE